MTIIGLFVNLIIGCFTVVNGRNKVVFSHSNFEVLQLFVAYQAGHVIAACGALAMLAFLALNSGAFGMLKLTFDRKGGKPLWLACFAIEAHWFSPVNAIQRLGFGTFAMA